MMEKKEVLNANGEVEYAKVTGSNWASFSNGVVIFNSTPHAITIQDVNGTLVSISPSQKHIINAKSVEESVDGDLFVKTSFVGDESGEHEIEECEKFFDTEFDPECDRMIIIGSMIAAQAYPGRVVAMCPVPGYERVAPEMKRMRCDKFTTFGEPAYYSKFYSKRSK